MGIGTNSVIMEAPRINYFMLRIFLYGFVVGGSIQLVVYMITQYLIPKGGVIRDFMAA